MGRKSGVQWIFLPFLQDISAQEIIESNDIEYVSSKSAPCKCSQHKRERDHVGSHLECQKDQAIQAPQNSHFSCESKGTVCPISYGATVLNVALWVFDLALVQFFPIPLFFFFRIGTITLWPFTLGLCNLKKFYRGLQLKVCVECQKRFGLFKNAGTVETLGIGLLCFNGMQIVVSH